MEPLRSSGAVFLVKSANQKLSPIVKVPYNGPARNKFPYRPEPIAPFTCSTYVSINATCPDTCALKRKPDGKPGGCYVDAGKTVHTINRLDKEAENLSGDEVIVAEADLISRAFREGVPQDGRNGKGRTVRLHVGGETSSEDATVFLAEAINGWYARGGGTAWTFTHRWMQIARRAWGQISVLASLDDPRDALKAWTAGYTSTIVVQKFKSKLAFVMHGFKFIPCPAETTEGITCVTCGLCLDSASLHARKTGIAFSLHGVHKPQGLVSLGLGQQRFKFLKGATKSSLTGPDPKNREV